MSEESKRAPVRIEILSSVENIPLIDKEEIGVGARQIRLTWIRNLLQLARDYNPWPESIYHFPFKTSRCYDIVTYQFT